MSRLTALKLYTVLFLFTSSEGVSLSGEERTLACPGEPVHYTCTSPRVNSITWDLTCQDQQAPYTPSVNMEVNTTHHHLPCTSANGGMVSYDLTLTYESDDSTTESNISITVLEIADSVTRLNSLRISCESQDSYKYLDVTGLPSAPLNLQVDFEPTCDITHTHVPTSISWSPAQEAESIYSAEGYGLTLSQQGGPQGAITWVNRTDEQRVTVPLLLDTTYTLNLFATSCGAKLRSRNVSIDISPSQNIFSCASPSEISRAKLNVVAATSCTLTFKCSEGLVPDEEVVKARCGPDGEWVPDPVQHVCTPVAVQENDDASHTDDQGDSGGEDLVIVISVVAISVFLSMCLALSLAAYLIYTCHWLRNKNTEEKLKLQAANQMKDGDTFIPTTALPLPPEPPCLHDDYASIPITLGDGFALDQNVAYASCSFPTPKASLPH